MATIPPWLNISPADFVGAAKEGAALGQRVAQSATQAALQREQIAASERENALRVGASQAAAAAAHAQSNAESDANRELKRWELEQQMLMNQNRLDLQDKSLAQRNDLALQHLGLDKGQLDIAGKKLSDAEAEAAYKKSAPIYRTVENQLIQVDPTTGDARSLFTAPYRPGTGGALQELLRQAGVGSTTNAPATSTGTSGARIPVISPDGRRGTVSPESLDEALANGYKRL